MKKVLVTFMLTITLISTINAQEDKQTRLSFLLSPQLSWMNSDHSTVSSGGNLSGYNFGLAVDRFFAPNYALATGLTINTTGGKLNFEDGATIEVGGVELEDQLSMTYRLKYIEIPFGLKLLTNEFHRTKYYGQFGLYGQFNIKASNSDGKSLNNEVKFFDMGYHLGAGLEYSIGGSTYLTFGLLYNNGFIDITSNNTIKDKTTLNRLNFNFGVIF